MFGSGAESEHDAQAHALEMLQCPCAVCLNPPFSGALCSSRCSSTRRSTLLLAPSYTTQSLSFPTLLLAHSRHPPPLTHHQAPPPQRKATYDPPISPLPPTPLSSPSAATGRHRSAPAAEQPVPARDGGGYTPNFTTVSLFQHPDRPLCRPTRCGASCWTTWGRPLQRCR